MEGKWLPFITEQVNALCQCLFRAPASCIKKLKQSRMASQPPQTSRVEELQQADMEETGRIERAKWIVNSPDPPGILQELFCSVKEVVFPYKNTSSKRTRPRRRVISFLQGLFPILDWGRNYTFSKFKHDLMAGLTLASLCIPQSIGYANLAKLDPQYGLYTSVVPPLIYAVMGSSREIAIGPVAVVSMLLSSMVQNLQDPETNPVAYRNLVFTVTLFAGAFQALFGLLRRCVLGTNMPLMLTLVSKRSEEDER